MKHQALKVLEAAERKAFHAEMNGSAEDACQIPGQEGKLYLAWSKAADACYEYRKAHGLIGLNWKQINALEE